ncbi:hypothetical protein LCGC14_2677610, partial [marine sediment metagenome]
MFQSFTSATRPEQGPPRLADLRALMQAEGFDAWLVPRADAHQGEYVAPHDDRLAWLTGFTGSAGFCIVLADQAGIFVDGRYTVQVKAQVAAAFTSVNWPATKPGPWLLERLGEGAVLGFDPWLHTAQEIETLEAALSPKGIALRATDNLLDRIWPDQPAPPAGPVTAYPQELAGDSAADKRARIAAILAEDGQSAAVLTLPDSIAWLLNIRGSDIQRTPIAQGFAIVDETGGVRLFMDPAKLSDMAAHLDPDVSCLPPDGLLAALATLSGPVRVDRATAPYIVSRTLTDEGIKMAWGADPCALPKATKSDAEIAATTQAHLRDGAAMCEFLCWLDSATAAAAEGARITEIDVVKKLEAARKATGELRDISFDTIAGSGPHGAIVHY